MDKLPRSLEFFVEFYALCLAEKLGKQGIRGIKEIGDMLSHMVHPGRDFNTVVGGTNLLCYRGMPKLEFESGIASPKGPLLPRVGLLSRGDLPM